MSDASQSGSLPVATAPSPVAALPGAGWQARLAGIADAPALRRAGPALIGVGALAAAAMLYLALAGSPQRILYASLSDGERAAVVEALESGGIAYAIDNGTGAITVAEDDIYRARMLVASDAGLAAPQGASEMLDAIPLGSSRTLEGERLRLARERELMLTIREIDGIEAVRVHLATPERSVFVRDSNPPSASVMLRLVSGRSLGERQVEAIVNLVSGSVPGMTADAVRVVDQNGRLLSSARDAEMDGLTLQREFEAKLQGQLAALLAPLLGEGNFSTQVQVELDQSEVTSARETYDKEGAVRSESERTATRMAARQPGGVPGVTANTPPPDATLVDGPPQPDGAADAGPAQAPPGDSESAVERNFELDREVAVTARRAGGLTKLSVAVAVSQQAMVDAAPLTPEELEALVSAAVGADAGRGDTVKIAVSKFETQEIEPPAFYEQAWFGQVLRYGAALIAVLLVLLFAVRPLLARARPAAGPAALPDDAAQAGAEAGLLAAAEADKAEPEEQQPGEPFAELGRQVQLARTLASEQPERALEALQRMLQPPADELNRAAS
jgi:flagellar M-ring protein FliF